MNAGIEVYNDNEKLVIDNNYKNLCLTRKIPIESLPELWPKVSYNGYVLKLETHEKLFAFELREKKRMIIYPYRIDERTWVLHLPYGSDSVGYPMYPDEIAGMHVYVFGLQTTPSDKNYGFVVYDKKGKICFDSNSKYMRITRYSFRNTEELMKDGYISRNSERIGYVGEGRVALVSIATFRTSLTTQDYSGGQYWSTINLEGWDGDYLYVERNHTMILYPDDRPEYYPVDCYERYRFNLMNGIGYMLLDVTGY